MDSGLHSDGGQSSRKRPRTSRENETEVQRLKREKAAERQRRKRERDRNAAGMGVMAFPPSISDHAPQHAPSAPTSADFGNPDLTPEEAARRDRVRAAARERQRKHRQLVKQRKLRELGMDMGNEILPGMEEMQYRLDAEGQYQAVSAHELQAAAAAQQAQAAQLQAQQQQQHAHAMGQHEPPFPQGQPSAGQTFASTLLLSFSCAPLLKQHLLRTLSMTNEELASLEPIIAEAWEHWDHQRRMQFAEQAGRASAAIRGVEYPAVDGAGAYAGGGPEGGAGAGAGEGVPNEFRARFHRPLVAPSPFRNFAGVEGGGSAAAGAGASTPTSASGSGTGSGTGSGHGPPSDPIDPHLSGAAPATNGTSEGRG